MKYILEIIGFNIESCIAAQDAGAGRIELCASPGEGGTTPSYSLIKAARSVLQIPLYVMVRPRGGDFLYSDNEFGMMYEDIRICRNLGVDGVVTGILDKNGNVDLARNSRLVGAAYPMGVTFHRAFDRVRDPRQALKDVIATGCERILTSGLRPKCVDGADMIRNLISIADRDISIMPGSGVTSSNIVEIMKKTGAIEIHSSASRNNPSAMIYQNPEMNESLTHITVNAEEVRKIAEALVSIQDAEA